MTRVQLNRLLTLETPTSVSDGTGGLSVQWTATGTLWADIAPGAGRDTASEEIRLTTVPYRITVRGAPVGSARRPQAGQRLVDGLRIFQVLAVTERDAAGHYLTCFAREEAPA